MIERILATKMSVLMQLVWRPGDILVQTCMKGVANGGARLHCAACLCTAVDPVYRLKQEQNHSRNNFLPKTDEQQNLKFFHTGRLKSQNNLTVSRLKLSRKDPKHSIETRRTIKQNGSKHYPSAHIFRLREIRQAVKCAIQKEAVLSREKLTISRKAMRAKVDGSFDKTKHLRENIMTVPNLLTTTRLALSPVLGYLVISEQYMLGTGLFLFTGLTDLLDGYIARNFKNQQSALGSIIDPLADKCLISILTISLTIAGLIPVPLTVLMFARDASLISASAYLRYKSLDSPFTWSSYFDVTHVTMKLSPTFISKVNTAVQLFLVGVTLPAPVFQYADNVFLHYLWYTTAATTILSGLSYIFSRNTFKLLGGMRSRDAKKK